MLGLFTGFSVNVPENPGFPSLPDVTLSEKLRYLFENNTLTNNNNDAIKGSILIKSSWEHVKIQLMEKVT